MKTPLGLFPVFALVPFGACSSSSAPDAPVAPDPGPRPPVHGFDASPGTPTEVDAGPTGIVTPNETAGTRLRPVYATYDAADGASWRFFESWYDTARGEPCGVQKMSDGKLHCAPVGEEPTLTPDSAFADAACTQPILGVGTWDKPAAAYCGEPTPPAANRYFRMTSHDDPCAPARLVAFPASSPLVLDRYFYKTASGCESVSLAGASFEIFAVQLPLVEVNPSSFVAFEARDATPDAPSRLRASRTEYAGEDGSKSTSPGRVVDASRHEFCSPRPAADGVLRCMPYGGVVDTYDFSDSSCTQPVFEVANNGNCAADDGRYTFFSYMEQTDFSACDEVRLYPRFTSGQVTNAYYGKPGACVAEELGHDPWYTRYAAPALPPPITATDFAPIARDTRETTGLFYGKPGARLHLTQGVTSGDDGFELLSPFVAPFDTEAKSACYVEMLPDGKFYCLPVYRYFDFDATRGDLYADAACTEPLVGVAHDDASGCGTPVDPSMVYADSPYAYGTCWAMHAYHLPAAPLVAPTPYARTSTNGCAPATIEASAYAFYRRRDLAPVQGADLVEVKVGLLR